MSNAFLSQYKKEAEDVEQKYLHQVKMKGGSISVAEMKDRLEYVQSLISPIDQELTALANRLITENKIELTDDLRNEIQGIAGQIVLKVIKSNTTGL